MALTKMSLVGVRELCSLHHLSSSPPRFNPVVALPTTHRDVARPGVRRCEVGRRTVIRAAGAGNDEVPSEVDVSVFRFTLGIPGFDDADLPRIVGILFGSLLLVNHAVSIESMTHAQLTSEALGLFLAGVACSLPSVGRRLKGGEAKKKDDNVSRPRSVFELSRRLNDPEKQELAWGTYSLLQNSRASALIVWHRDEVVCARGSFDLGTMVRGAKALPVLQDMLNNTPFIHSSDPFYVSEGADTKGWPIVPKNMKSILVQPFEKSDSSSSVAKGGLILFSYQPRSYTSKDRKWIAMIAKKFSHVLKT